MYATPPTTSPEAEILHLRSELQSARGLLDRQQLLLARLEPTAAHATEREDEAATLRQAVAQERSARQELERQLIGIREASLEGAAAIEAERQVRQREAATSAAELEAAKTLLDSAATAAARAEGECLTLRSALHDVRGEASTREAALNAAISELGQRDAAIDELRTLLRVAEEKGRTAEAARADSASVAAAAAAAAEAATAEATESGAAVLAYREKHERMKAKVGELVCHLPTSPRISPHLPASLHISPHLSTCHGLPCPSLTVWLCALSRSSWSGHAAAASVRQPFASRYANLPTSPSEIDLRSPSLACAPPTAEPYQGGARRGA